MGYSYCYYFSHPGVNRRIPRKDVREIEFAAVTYASLDTPLTLLPFCLSEFTVTTDQRAITAPRSIVHERKLQEKKDERVSSNDIKA